jgi:hypothetical protein
MIFISSAHWPINQPINQSINQSINRSINRLTNHRINPILNEGRTDSNGFEGHALGGYRVHFAEPRKDNMKTLIGEWNQLIKEMGGTVSDPEQADAQVVYLNSSGRSNQEDVSLIAACDRRVKVLSNEWLIQCLLHGRRVKEDAFLLFDPAKDPSDDDNDDEEEDEDVGGRGGGGARKSSSSSSSSSSSGGGGGGNSSEEGQECIGVTLARKLMARQKKTVHKVQIKATTAGASKVGTFESDSKPKDTPMSRFEVGDFVCYELENGGGGGGRRRSSAASFSGRPKKCYGKIVAFPEDDHDHDHDHDDAMAGSSSKTTSSAAFSSSSSSSGGGGELEAQRQLVLLQEVECPKGTGHSRELSVYPAQVTIRAGQLLNRIVLVKSPIFQALKFKNDPKFYFTKDRMFTGKEG